MRARGIVEGTGGGVQAMSVKEFFDERLRLGYPEPEPEIAGVAGHSEVAAAA